MKKIDISNPTFEKLITCNNIYVDKTRYLYNLLTDGGTYYFCSRPRRFGKTLTVNTLEQIFKGRKELFKGLYIDSTDYDWKEYPVIHIDFGAITYINIDNLRNQIKNLVLGIAKNYDVTIPLNLEYNEALRFLIEELSKKEKVVILIDEYDKIISDNIYHEDIKSIRDIISGFYSVFKSENDNIRFCFITGVTKYSKVSIFSSMNNLRDISFEDEYAYLLGYTDEELIKYFNDYIEEGIEKSGLQRNEYLNKLKFKYDGYRFTSESKTLYNPVSIGSFFASGGKQFNNYWIETGNTKLLADIAKKVKYNIDNSLDEPMSRDDISYFDIVDIASSSVSLMQYKSLLFQSGYLTIKKAEDDGNTLFLDYPNNEVKSAFASTMLNVYANIDTRLNLNSVRLRNAFEDRNIEKAMMIIKSYFANVSYLLTDKSKESDYHLMFHSMLVAIDGDVNVELLTNKGRIDAVLKTKNTIYVIEFKRDKSAKEAIDQIKDKGYMEKYLAWKTDNPNHEIYLLGINFNSKERNIDDWKLEIA